jgi:hypothetical protein
MEKIDEFIDYSTGNQEELTQIARIFEWPQTCEIKIDNIKNKYNDLKND